MQYAILSLHTVCVVARPQMKKECKTSLHVKLIKTMSLRTSENSPTPDTPLCESGPKVKVYKVKCLAPPG